MQVKTRPALSTQRTERMDLSEMYFLDTQILLDFLYERRPNHVQCRSFCDDLPPNMTLVQQEVVIELTNILLNAVSIYSAELRNGIKRAKAAGNDWNNLKQDERARILENVAVRISGNPDPNVRRFAVFVQALIRDTLLQICDQDEEKVLKFLGSVTSSYTWIIIERIKQRFVNVHLASNGQEVYDFRKHIAECFNNQHVFQANQSQDMVILGELCAMSKFGFVAYDSNKVFSEKEFTFCLRDKAFMAICLKLQSLLCNGKGNSSDFCKPISSITFVKPY